MPVTLVLKDTSNRENFLQVVPMVWYLACASIKATIEIVSYIQDMHC
jgi:hypothetical protein